jgi:signal transduction histidine kinase
VGTVLTSSPPTSPKFDSTDTVPAVPIAPRRERRLVAALKAFTEHLPGALILVALCSLVGFNYYQRRSIASSLREINQVLEPATRAASDLQFALSREAASTRAFLLTGNAEYTPEFHQARAARREALRQLVALSPAVAPVDELLNEAAAQLGVADRWLDGLYSGTITRDAYLVEFPNQHRRFSSVIARVATLHQRLRVKATAYRDAIDATQRLGMLLELAGIGLAILGAVAVGRLKTRERAARIASESAQRDAELRRAELERTTARWMRLIRGFSHDLKNPLNAADGYLFMLEQGAMGPLSPAHTGAVATIRHNMHTAIALTSDLVDLARAETAGVDVRRVQMNLCDVVARVVEDYAAQASAKGLALTTELPRVPETVQSDPARVSQILGNLVSNAVKYTRAGRVTVAVERRAENAGDGWIVVHVSDTGPGIPTEDQRRIFDEFERLDLAGPAGTGIGLAISQRLAHTLGGTITLKSQAGRGSTFTLCLPPTTESVTV